VDADRIPAHFVLCVERIDHFININPGYNALLPESLIPFFYILKYQFFIDKKS